MIKAVMWSLLVAGASVAHADTFMTGAQLFEKMGGEVSDRALAMGYVEGVFDGVAGACAPPPVSSREVYDATRRRLESQPSERQRPAAQFVLAAILESWPCKKP